MLDCSIRSEIPFVDYAVTGCIMASRRVAFALVCFILVMLTGCGIHRITAIAHVDDLGDGVATKHKYNLREWNFDVPDDDANGMKALMMTNEDFKRILPEVFSDTGVPFSLKEKNTKIIKGGNGVSAVLGILTLGILPIFRDSKYEIPFEMTLGDSKIRADLTGLANRSISFRRVIAQERKPISKI